MSKEHPIEVRDMAIVHRLFRQAYDEAARLVRAGPAPSPGRVTFLADHIDLVLGGLPSHHQDEDELLYPILIERVPEQAPMTEQVEHEHQVIATALDTASAACATWRQRPSAQTRRGAGGRARPPQRGRSAPPRRRGAKGRPARRGDAHAAGVGRHGQARDELGSA
jgi:hypothetical protein